MPDRITLEDYFRSIEASFRETLESRAKGQFRGYLLFISVLLFIFSIVPLVPLLLARAIPKLYGATVFVYRRYNFPLNSLWFWWLLSAVLFGLVFFAVSGRRNKWREERRRRSLPTPQMRFAFCYAIVSELKKYQTNKFEQHLESCMRYWPELMSCICELFYSPFLLPHQLLAPEVKASATLTAEAPETPTILVPFSHLHFLERRFSWFRMEPGTSAIVTSIESLPGKLLGRLKDKKDLAQVRECLSDLSAYLYTLIPDTSAALEETENKVALTFQENCLRTLSLRLRALPEYTSEPEVHSERQSPLKWLGTSLESVSRLFSNQSMLICFLSWYVLCLIFVLFPFRVAYYFLPQLPLDSVVISTLIGAPLAGAVSATAMSRSKDTKGKPGT